MSTEPRARLGRPGPAVVWWGGQAGRETPAGGGSEERLAAVEPGHEPIVLRLPRGRRLLAARAGHTPAWRPEVAGRRPGPVGEAGVEAVVGGALHGIGEEGDGGEDAYEAGLILSLLLCGVLGARLHVWVIEQGHSAECDLSIRSEIGRGTRTSESFYRAKLRETDLHFAH